MEQKSWPELPIRTEEDTDFQTQPWIIVTQENQHWTHLKKSKSLWAREDFGAMGEIAECGQELLVKWQMGRLGDQMRKHTEQEEDMFER